MPCFLQVCFQSFCSVALFAVLLALGPFGSYAMDALKGVVKAIKPNPTAVRNMHVSLNEEQEKEEKSVMPSVLEDHQEHSTQDNSETKQLVAQCYRELAIMEKQLKVTKQALLLVEKGADKKEAIKDVKQNYEADPLNSWNHPLKYELAVPCADQSSDSENDDSASNLMDSTSSLVADSNE